MTADEAIAQLEAMLPPGSFTGVKQTVFRGAWQGLGYGQMAERQGYDADYLRESGASLWRSLSQLLGMKVNKKNFRPLLLQRLGGIVVTGAAGATALEWAEMDRAAIALPGPDPLPTEIAPAEIAPAEIAAPYCDWGDAPDVSVFYGRGQELDQLRRWLLGDGEVVSCRLISLLGLGGLGKTSLAAKLAQSCQATFDAVIWRSLRDAPPLADLLGDILGQLGESAAGSNAVGWTSAAGPTAPAAPSRSQLLALLRQYRCLLLLDNAETLLQSGQSRRYRSGYEDYEHLFRALGESAHTSCAIVTSREKLPGFAQWESQSLAVRSLVLAGSAEITQALLERNGQLRGSDRDRAALGHACGHSPLALKLTTTTIQELFDGDIAAFLAEKPFACDGIRRLLETHLCRLPPLERQILTWLAINRSWTSRETLLHDLVPAVPRPQLLQALAGLQGRCLVEVRSGRYGLQATVMEYLTEDLIRQASQEVVGGLAQWLRRHRCLGAIAATTLLDSPAASDPLAPEPPAEPLPLLYSHALVKATAPEYLRQRQSDLILAPLAQLLGQWSGSTQLATHQFRTLLQQLHRHSLGQSGYCAGNLLNLALHLGLNLGELDFSRLCLRQVDLRRPLFQSLNLADALLLDCAFIQQFGGILCLDYSPDGRWVATGDAQGQIQLWDLERSQLEASWGGHGGHGGQVHCLAFSPEGGHLASGGDDGLVYLWAVPDPGGPAEADPGTGERPQALAQLAGHQRFVWSIAWGPAGDWLESGGGDRSLRRWWVGDLTAPPGWVAQPPEALGRSAHPPGDRCCQVIESPSSWIHAVAVHPDGSLLVSGSSDGALRLWDPASGQYLGVLLGHRRWVSAVAFSPGGDRIASASHDGELRLWDSDSAALLAVLKGHGSAVSALAFSPDGGQLVSSSTDQTLRLWDLTHHSCLRTLTGHVGWVQAVAFSPDGRHIASGGHDQTLRLWEGERGRCLTKLVGYASGLRSIDWHPQGDRLISCAGDHSLYLWDWASGQQLQRLSAEGSGLSTGRWSPDGEQIVTGGKDHQLRIWQLQPDGHPQRHPQLQNRPQPQRLLSGHGGWVCSLALSPDGQTLASGSADHSIRLWDWASGQCHGLLEGHSSRVCSLSFSPDGRFLFSGGADHSIRQWDSPSGRYLRPLHGHGDWVTALGVSPQGRYLASASLDRCLKLWHLDSGRCLISLSCPDHPITDLAWHPDGQQLATASSDRTMLLWSLPQLLAAAATAEATGPEAVPQPQSRPQQRLLGHGGPVWSLAYSPDGRYLASASEDGTCKIWDIPALLQPGDSQPGGCCQTLAVLGPYASLMIAGSQGLTSAQQAMLMALGAQVGQRSPSSPPPLSPNLPLEAPS